jgi:very-short-patch-repair endonuclease
MDKISKTEDILYEAMLDLGLKPERQYSFKQIEKYGYKLDFAFPKERVNIEVDGIHHLTKERRKQDNKRDDVLDSFGWRVKRIDAEDTYQDPQKAVWEIKRFLNRNNREEKSLSDYDKIKKEEINLNISKQVINTPKDKELAKQTYEKEYHLPPIIITKEPFKWNIAKSSVSKAKLSPPKSVKKKTNRSWSDKTGLTEKTCARCGENLTKREIGMNSKFCSPCFFKDQKCEDCGSRIIPYREGYTKCRHCFKQDNYKSSHLSTPEEPDTREHKFIPKKKNKKTWLWIFLALIIFGFIFYPAIKDRVEMKNWADLPTAPTGSNQTASIVCTADAKQCPDGSYVRRVAPSCEFKVCPALPDYVVNGSMQNVIIKNNLASGISLNVTYRILSNWFGTDRTETQIFEVGANSEKSFEVYSNGGCVYSSGKTLDCSVSIISQKRI